MNRIRNTVDRREFLTACASLGAAAAIHSAPTLAGNALPISRVIPASGERLPVIGMGSWITFNVGSDAAERATRVQVLKHFFEQGGAIVDSSPMYGRSEEVIGYCLDRLENKSALFSATKVWMVGQRLGVIQMEHSESLWARKRFDLIQIHNMVDWKSHLETLKGWKAEGRIRYLGITTSHGRRHDEVEAALTTESFDFVQFTYNVIDREAESRLLPLARDRGVAVLVNRPFRRGALFDRVQGKPIPDWAGDFDCQNWAQFFLKFVVSHPAVTAAIPATSQVPHMLENMGAGYGRLPDPDTRRRMIRYFEEVA